MSNINVILKLAFVLAIYILSVNGMNENEKLAIAKLRVLFSNWNTNMATSLDACGGEGARYQDVVSCANGIFQRSKLSIIMNTDIETSKRWIDTYINDVPQETGGALNAPLASILTKLKSEYSVSFVKEHQS